MVLASKDYGLRNSAAKSALDLAAGFGAASAAGAGAAAADPAGAAAKTASVVVFAPSCRRGLSCFSTTRGRNAATVALDGGCGANGVLALGAGGCDSATAISRPYECVASG